MLLIKCIKFYIIRGCVSVFKEIFVLELVISAQCLIVPGKCLCGTRVTLHRMAAQTRVCLLLISDLLCPLPFENLLHVLLGTQTSELLMQNEGKILSQLEHRWETQSQGLTRCKLGSIHWNQLTHGHCEPGVVWAKVLLSHNEGGSVFQSAKEMWIQNLPLKFSEGFTCCKHIAQKHPLPLNYYRKTKYAAVTIFPNCL